MNSLKLFLRSYKPRETADKTSVEPTTKKTSAAVVPPLAGLFNAAHPSGRVKRQRSKRDAPAVVPPSTRLFNAAHPSGRVERTLSSRGAATKKETSGPGDLHSDRGLTERLWRAARDKTTAMSEDEIRISHLPLDKQLMELERQLELLNIKSICDAVPRLTISDMHKRNIRWATEDRERHELRKKIITVMNEQARLPKPLDTSPSRGHLEPALTPRFH